MKPINKKPRLGLVVPSLAQSGGVPAVARFVRDTVIRSGDYELKLISLSMSSNDPASVLLSRPTTWMQGVQTIADEWEGLPFMHVGAYGGELEFQRYRPRRALAEATDDCDLLQMVCGSPAWANAVLGLGKPVALQVATLARVERRMRDAKPTSLPDLWRKAMTPITDRMDDRALRHVDAIQVENPWMLDYARKLNADSDVDLRYAPPGVDASCFCQKSYRDVQSDPYILCVARLDDPRKNIGLLLEAYARLLLKTRGVARLVLAGASGPPPAFWRRADELGVKDCISYIERPELDALVTLYQNAALFALPSDEEGLGVVILEAMSCAVPVVSTACGGPDGIITDGEDGYLVPVDDAVAMAERFELLLENPTLNLSMGRSARRTIEQRYAENVAGAAFVDMWDCMLSEKRKI